MRFRKQTDEDALVEFAARLETCQMPDRAIEDGDVLAVIGLLVSAVTEDEVDPDPVIRLLALLEQDDTYAGMVQEAFQGLSDGTTSSTPTDVWAGAWETAGALLLSGGTSVYAYGLAELIAVCCEVMPQKKPAKKSSSIRVFAKAPNKSNKEPERPVCVVCGEPYEVTVPDGQGDQLHVCGTHEAMLLSQLEHEEKNK